MRANSWLMVAICVALPHVGAACGGAREAPEGGINMAERSSSTPCMQSPECWAEARELRLEYCDADCEEKPSSQCTPKKNEYERLTGYPIACEPRTASGPIFVHPEDQPFVPVIGRQLATAYIEDDGVNCTITLTNEGANLEPYLRDYDVGLYLSQQIGTESCTKDGWCNDGWPGVEGSTCGGDIDGDGKRECVLNHNPECYIAATYSVNSSAPGITLHCPGIGGCAGLNPTLVYPAVHPDPSFGWFHIDNGLGACVGANIAGTVQFSGITPLLGP